ncbi:MAG: tRNA (N(6)-L-threonylcarbamoyladenosine(37)-C(2))-methylthiotransferase MtaB [Eubacterium sp.]|nr:tRNA (N(6)-L-threonylcarbamoyladenosine(37)-C(2))-methylthiotransferase MtaB [Eubacterium sp.]
MRKAALHNLGCKVNAYETEAMQQLLEDAGYEIVAFTQKADVYVVNTCSVTNIADRKSRQMLHRARRNNPQAVIVAAGCYVQAKDANVLEEGIADIVLGNNKKEHLIPAITEYLNTHMPVREREALEDKAAYEPLSISRTQQHTRAFMKVQDGCNQFCSYCIIPYTRGRVRSRQPQEVLEEAARLAQNGCREIVLTGIHLSSYGVDHGAPYGEGLLRLLAQVHEVAGIKRIRLGSLEPGIITETFAQALAGMEKVCPHFHLSLQSGCDTVLKRMNRKYTADVYEQKCQILRRCFSRPAITTDVIVGFPGETEEEFIKTEQFLETISFYEMHIFKYSRRKGTKAASMDCQVPDSVKAQRSARLIGLGEKMSKAFRESFIGDTVYVLLEEPFVYLGKRYEAGYTQEYVKVAVESDKSRTNTIVRGKITGYLTQDVYIMVEF